MSTRITHDPPYEPVVPASQAASENLRRVAAYYRRKGQTGKAEYLEAILEDREGGIEERHLGPGPHPSGSEQDILT